MMETPLVRLVGVEKRYEGESPTMALRGVDLAIEPGEAVAIVGPSGSGKTTLLNMIAGLDRPSRGDVYFEERNLADMSGNELAKLRNLDIGMIFQLHYLLPQCSILENVLLPTLASDARMRLKSNRAKRSPDSTITSESPDSRARRLLARVGLSGRLSHRPGQLSGGERQRAAVVRALINGPKLLLADEPTGSLDRAASESLAELLIELNREEGVALLVITHERELAARMTRIMELRDGVLVSEEIRR